MSTPTRCERCDHTKATAKDWAVLNEHNCPEKFGPCSFMSELCWGTSGDCTHPEVDWRARCLKAEAELTRGRPLIDALTEARAARFEAQQERNAAMAQVMELRGQLSLLSTPLSPEALQAIAEESAE